MGARRRVERLEHVSPKNDIESESDDWLSEFIAEDGPGVQKMFDRLVRERAREQRAEATTWEHLPLTQRLNEVDNT